MLGSEGPARGGISLACNFAATASSSISGCGSPRFADAHQQHCAMATDSDAAVAMKALLGQLPDGSRVAVVSMLGSLCPITLGHVQCYEEARSLLLNRAPTVPRPEDLEDFAECVGFVYLNGDGYVGNKLRQKGQKALDYDQRCDLVRLATADLPWLCFGGRGTLEDSLSEQHPNLKFVRYDMNGADDVVRHHKWEWAGKSNRMITMGRPGFTDDVRSGIQSMVDRGKYAPKHCLLGPELPDISSTAARAASAAGDQEALLEILHPSVADWLLCSDGHADVVEASRDVQAAAQAPQE